MSTEKPLYQTNDPQSFTEVVSSFPRGGRIRESSRNSIKRREVGYRMFTAGGDTGSSYLFAKYDCWQD